MTDVNAWEAFAAKHQVGDRMHLIIESIVLDMGLLLELPGGIRGIVHLNDLDWRESGDAMIERYSLGDTVEVIVTAIEVGKKRISLGVKQLGPNPRDRGDSGDPSPVPHGSPGPVKPTLSSSRSLD